ncbi:MAG: DUF3592 domain-containing protein [Archangium sp.]
MKLAIPSPPRAVKLQQIPGALRRVGSIAAIFVVATLVAWVAVRAAQAPLASQHAFLRDAEEVDGKVIDVTLPPLEKRLQTPARLRVIYKWKSRDMSATSVPVDAEEAEKLFNGVPVKLLVDPAHPSHAQEASWARAQAGWVWLGSAVFGVGLLVAAAAVFFELRRAVRREVDPLRVGALVWLTPDAPLPETKDDLKFTGHYFRENVKHSVTARVRPGRRPVRNGEKVLAAVLPSLPTWARVVDEEIAQDLGWYRNG